MTTRDMRVLRLAPDPLSRDALAGGRPVSYEDLFLDRYERLRTRALTLTAHDHGLAEDLLHDAFIQFTLIRPSLDGIGDLNAYLGGMLRLMHASHVRRAARRGITATSLDDLELLAGDMGSLAAAEARAELALLCRYACLRKETSKAGSILILRFLLGYFPSEIARIARLSPPAVDQWLRLARREARLFRDDPGKLTFLAPPVSDESRSVAPVIPANDPVELLRSLRATVFTARHGKCPSRAALRREYEPPLASRGMATPQLAHIVSCPSCLDRVSALLVLPALSGRFPDDPPSPPVGRSGGDGVASRRSEDERRDRRRRNVVEHRPEELCVAVNGRELARYTVGQRITRHALSINVNEPLAFVEVFSADGVRLLFAAVDPFPSGPLEQSTQVVLSEDRRLDVTVQFSEPWPTMEVVYRDPHWMAADVQDDREAAPAPVTPWPAAGVTSSWWSWLGTHVGGRTRLATAMVLVLVAWLLAFGDASAMWRAARDLGYEALRALGMARVVAPSPPPPPPLSPATPPRVVPPPLSSLSPPAFVGRPLIEVEVDVLRRLDGIGALLGQEAVVSRRAGRVIVQAYGAVPERREAITQAMSHVEEEPLILLFDPPARTDSALVEGRPALQVLDAPASAYPLQVAVERVLIANSIVDATDRAALEREARAVAVRVLGEARTVLLNAGALRDITLRFSKQDAATMSARTRSAWRAIGQGRARDVERATATLVASLAPWLAEETSTRERAADTSSDPKLQSLDEGRRRVERLFSLATSIDQVVQEAFTVGVDPPATLRITQRDFKATLAEAQAVASTLQSNRLGPGSGGHSDNNR